MKRLARVATVVAALAALTLLTGRLAGLFGDKIEPGAFAPPLDTPGGETVAVTVVDQPTFEHATGTVEAKNETLVSPRIMATIGAVHVRSGDRVEAGQVLVELDSRELTARVQQAEQSVASAEAQLTEARSHYERTARLEARDAASKSELERALAAFRAAQAELARARDRLSETRSARSHATITAPIAGRVVERYAEPGDTAVPGTPLLRLYDPGALRLEAHVREAMAARLQVGDMLRVRIDATGAEMSAPIEEVVPSADPGSRSFVVKLPLGEVSGLYPGMYGRVEIPTGSTRRLRIPASAVQRVGQLEFVVVAGPQGTARRFVRTGRKAADGWVDVLSGLEAGERVVVRPS